MCGTKAWMGLKASLQQQLQGPIELITGDGSTWHLQQLPHAQHRRQVHRGFMHKQTHQVTQLLQTGLPSGTTHKTDLCLAIRPAYRNTPW